MANHQGRSHMSDLRARRTLLATMYDAEAWLDWASRPSEDYSPDEHYEAVLSRWREIEPAVPYARQALAMLDRSIAGADVPEPEVTALHNLITRTDSPARSAQVYGYTHDRIQMIAWALDGVGVAGHASDGTPLRRCYYGGPPMTADDLRETMERTGLHASGT
jgi:hypothetical protein